MNEMVDMMLASRAYEANATAIASAKKIVKDALDI
jgi:flagellar basal body rod protein FlgC